MLFHRWCSFASSGFFARDVVGSFPHLRCLIDMHIDPRRLKIAAAILLALNGYLVFAFVLSRPPLSADEWSFLDHHRSSLEQQRSAHGDAEVHMTLVSHGWNFALLRRPLSGYESMSVRLFLLANLPAYFTSFFLFQSLQESASTSSRLNSDVSSAVFAAISVAQWIALSTLFSIRRSKAT